MPKALITGASSGIGLALAEQFIAENIPVILVATRAERLRSIQKRLGIDKVTMHVCDLTDEQALTSLLSQYDQTSDVKYLINNAGIGDAGVFETQSWETLNRMLQLNIVALTRLSQHFIPILAKYDRSYIMNVSSTAGTLPVSYLAVYAASKAYVTSFSLALSQEVKEQGIVINTLCPGPTNTEFASRGNMIGKLGFKRKWIPSAEEVAYFAIKSMRTETLCATHGFLNRLFYQCIVPLVPAAIAARIGAYILRKQFIRKRHEKS